MYHVCIIHHTSMHIKISFSIIHHHTVIYTQFCLPLKFSVHNAYNDCVIDT